MENHLTTLVEMLLQVNHLTMTTLVEMMDTDLDTVEVMYLIVYSEDMTTLQLTQLRL